MKQETFNFGQENFITTIFFDFLEKKYFNFFLSFGAAQSSFIVLKLPDYNLQEVLVKLRSKNFCLLENKGEKQINLKQTIFVNLEAYFGKGIESELNFLDFMKGIIPQGVCFLAVCSEDFAPKFNLLDVKSRFESAIFLNFTSDTPFDFYELAQHFLLKHAIKVEPEILKAMILQIDREIKSFTIFIEELKKFIEANKVKVNRHHFKAIFENYENRRKTGSF